jgi:hypothetical protein
MYGGGELWDLLDHGFGFSASANIVLAKNGMFNMKLGGLSRDS